jgi:hypothetical protein
MSRFASTLRCLSVLSAVLLGTTLVTAAEGVRGPSGRYRVLSAQAHRAPPFEIVEFAYEPNRAAADRACSWQLTVRAREQGDVPPLLRLRGVTNRDPLADAPEPLTFQAYVIEVPALNQRLDYRNVHTGQALLPAWDDFARHFLPRAVRGAGRQQGFPNSCEYLGHVLSLRGVGQTDWPVWRDVKVLSLDPELLIGTGRTKKDQEGRRLPQQPERRDYTYVPWTKDDYAAMIEAGFNYFALVPGIERTLQTQAVFYRGEASIAYPADLYRSNLLGPIMFLDEPACIMTGDKEVNGHLRYFTDAAQLLTKRVRAEAEQAASHYGRLLDKDINFGDMRLIQPDFAAWETRYETAFYQLAGGTAAIVHEGRYQLNEFNAWLKASTGMDRAFTAEQMLRYHYAFLRGAARHFHKDWGTSIYGQADPKISPLAVALAYDLGARHVWYWTSDHEHHLPFVEQLELTRSLRRHVAARPRPSIRGAQPVLDKAIVVPYGYLIVLESPAARKNSWDLWWVREMDAEGKNEAAQRYARLRKAVAREVVQAFDSGEDFDILHDDGGEVPGYRRVVRLKAE